LRARSFGPEAKALSASASRTAGRVSFATIARTAATASRVVPTPGPIAIASREASSFPTGPAARADSVPAPDSASGSVIASAWAAATIGCTLLGVAIVTRPAPERSAARARSTAAPLFPREPATPRRCPIVPLCAAGGRAGSRRRAASRSIHSRFAPAARTASSGIPMSMTRNVPA
jgi:hypothetical protein